MKTIDVNARDDSLRRLLREAQDDDLILRTVDGDQYLLMAVDEFDDEVARTQKNAALMALLDERALQTEAIDADEFARQLGLDDV